MTEVDSAAGLSVRGADTAPGAPQARLYEINPERHCKLAECRHLSGNAEDILPAFVDSFLEENGAFRP